MSRAVVRIAYPGIELMSKENTIACFIHPYWVMIGMAWVSLDLLTQTNLLFQPTPRGFPIWIRSPGARADSMKIQKVHHTLWKM